MIKEIYNLTGIYQIRNVKTDAAYIGQTRTSFGDRWDSHRSLLNSGKHSNLNLQIDWNEYGESSFVFEIIELARDDFDYDSAEARHIANKRACGVCYNILDGGKSCPNTGKHLSDETKRKIGDKNREHRLGSRLSEETRQKMSAAHKKRYSEWTDEERAAHGQKSSECARGYKWSDEAKAAFSAKQRQSPNSAKYSIDDIRNIRKLRSEGMKLKDIAERYNTTAGYISSIVQRRRWSDI